MLSVVILGTGNVARYFFEVLMANDQVRVIQVLGRSTKGLDHFRGKVDTSNDFAKIPFAQIYILAVSDDSVAQVAHFLKGTNGLVVHTSGSVALTDLPDSLRRGVLYPLQTFSQQRPLQIKAPLCLEAESEKDLSLLEELATKVSDQVFEISSEQRSKLHLAAVFVNNFTNHLFHLAQEICDEGNVPFELLKPLILETVKKIDYISPLDAQTGPAKRRDRGTMERHMQLLKTQNQKAIYQLLSSSIQNAYGKKL